MHTRSPRAEKREFDTRHFRDALSQFATGVTVITTRLADGSFLGLTASSLIQSHSILRWCCGV